LITGASGVGKSTVRSVVAPELSPAVECAELLDLTPRPDAMTRVWRQQAAEAAVRRAVQLQPFGRHLLLAGDPVPAAEIVAAPSAPQLDAIAACLLDASPDSQAERKEMRWERLERLAPARRMHTVDTTHMTRREVADAVLDWCRRALAGDAPALRVSDPEGCQPDDSPAAIWGGSGVAPGPTSALS
jgi:hypothetical protein